MFLLASFLMWPNHNTLNVTVHKFEQKHRTKIETCGNMENIFNMKILKYMLLCISQHFLACEPDPYVSLIDPHYVPQTLRYVPKQHRIAGSQAKYFRVCTGTVNKITIFAILCASVTRSINIITSSSTTSNLGNFLPISCSMRWYNSTSYLEDIS